MRVVLEKQIKIWVKDSYDIEPENLNEFLESFDSEIGLVAEEFDDCYVGRDNIWETEEYQGFAEVYDDDKKLKSYGA